MFVCFKIADQLTLASPFVMQAVPPVHRSPLNLDTWVTILSKKIQNWWPWVSDIVNGSLVSQFDL
jgi:hypothetical protein